MLARDVQDSTPAAAVRERLMVGGWGAAGSLKLEA
jgi:hypothetical protein